MRSARIVAPTGFIVMMHLSSKVTRFVVLFEGRTGSTWLTEHLNSHPQIQAKMEILGPYQKGEPSVQIAVARKALTPKIVSRYKAIGFKTKLRVVQDQTAFVNLLIELNVRIIHMRRANRLKTALSMINSNILKSRIDDFNVHKAEERLGATHVDVKKFDSVLEMREELDKKLSLYIEDTGLTRITINYEDLVEQFDAEMAKLYSFLGVNYYRTQSSLLKSTDDDLSKAIINFAEFEDYYKGTKYEKMLYE